MDLVLTTALREAIAALTARNPRPLRTPRFDGVMEWEEESRKEEDTVAGSK